MSIHLRNIEMVASNSRWFYLLDVLAAAGVGLMIIRSATWGRRKTIGTVKDNVIAPEGASHTLEDREESDSISGSFDAAPSQDESPELTAPPKLSREDSKALSDLMQLVNTGGLEKRLHPYIAVAAESFESYCLRFLRARKSNPKLAFDMLEADLKWRESVGVNEVASLEAHEVLGCQISAIWPYTPQWLQGHDRAGRPIIYKGWGSFYFNKIKEQTSLPEMVRYHLWVNEQGVREMGQQSVKLGKRIDKFTCVFNAKGFTPVLMRHGAMSFLKEIAMMDQDHYPERLAQIIVINAPRLVSLVWSAVRVYLDPVTRDKIHIHAGESEWRQVIDQLIDRDNLIDTFGGNAEVQFPTGCPVPIQTEFLPGAASTTADENREAEDSTPPSPMEQAHCREKKDVMQRRKSKIPSSFSFSGTPKAN